MKSGRGIAVGAGGVESKICRVALSSKMVSTGVPGVPVAPGLKPKTPIALPPGRPWAADGLAGVIVGVLYEHDLVMPPGAIKTI